MQQNSVNLIQYKTDCDNVQVLFTRLHLFFLIHATTLLKDF